MRESLIEVLSLLEVLNEDNVPRRVKIKIHKVVDGISVFKIPLFVIYNTVAVRVIYSVISLGQISVVIQHFFLKIPIFVVYNPTAFQVVCSVTSLGQISAVVRHFFLKIPIFVVYNPIAFRVVCSVTPLEQISAVVWRFFLKISVVVVVRKSLTEI
jgi:hypothetical protein